MRRCQNEDARVKSYVFYVSHLYILTRVRDVYDLIRNTMALPLDILKKVAEFMLIAERTIALGSGRKEFVLAQVKILLGDEQFAEYKPLIDLAIETIIMISHADIDIKKINPKKCFPCC